MGRADDGCRASAALPSSSANGCDPKRRRRCRNEWLSQNSARQTNEVRFVLDSTRGGRSCRQRMKRLWSTGSQYHWKGPGFRSGGTSRIPVRGCRYSGGRRGKNRLPQRTPRAPAPLAEHPLQNRAHDFEQARSDRHQTHRNDRVPCGPIHAALNLGSYPFDRNAKISDLATKLFELRIDLSTRFRDAPFGLYRIYGDAVIESFPVRPRLSLVADAATTPPLTVLMVASAIWVFTPPAWMKSVGSCPIIGSVLSPLSMDLPRPEKQPRIAQNPRCPATIRPFLTQWIRHGGPTGYGCYAEHCCSPRPGRRAQAFRQRRNPGRK